jgi:Tol biopolymer transport system component
VSLDGAPHHILGSQTLFDLPSWSDEGQRVLAMDRSTIFSVKPDGSDSRAIPGGATSTPAWSASGQMAYIVQNGSNYDLSVTQPRGSPKRITQGQVGPVSGRAWSPDGALLALVAGGRVWTARPDASGRTAITPAGGKAFRAVAFSPDGTTLAWYTSDGSVWVAGVDGSGAHRAGASGESFAWSPDNSHLVVSGADLTVLPAGAGAGAGDSRSLGVGGSQVAWSPDGRRIAYVADTKIAVVNADGTGRVDLTDVPAGVALGRGLAWSPDGSHLLVNTGTAGRPGPAPPA